MVLSFLLTSFSMFTSLLTISLAIVFSSLAVDVSRSDGGDYAVPET